MQLLATTDPKDVPSGKLYWYGLFGGAQRYFVPNDEAFQQMKSSGSLTFLDRELASAIAYYDMLCRQMEEYQKNTLDIYTEVRKSRALLFHFHYNEIANTITQSNLISMNQARVDSFIALNPPLLSTDKLLFNQYVEMIRSRRMNKTIDNANELLKQAEKLLAMLKDEDDD